MLARRIAVADATAGRVEQEVQLLGRRCAVALRTMAAAGASVLAFFTAPVTAVLLAVWGAVYYSLMSKGLSRNWPLAADAAVVAVACLTQRSTVPPEFMHGPKSWVLILASDAVAAYQWHSSIRVGAITTMAIAGAYYGLSVYRLCRCSSH